MALRRRFFERWQLGSWGTYGALPEVSEEKRALKESFSHELSNAIADEMEAQEMYQRLMDKAAVLYGEDSWVYTVLREIKGQEKYHHDQLSMIKSLM